jgi:mono/diheme cytochrome c family protein
MTAHDSRSSNSIGRRLAVLALAAGLLPVVLLRAQDSGGGAPPKIRFEKTVHDFGELRSDEKVSFDWVYHNDGGSPLSIIRTRTSCGCTMSVAEEESVPPGGSGTIHIDFDPVGMSGSVRKVLAVTSDDPEQQISRLTIRARITPVDLPIVETGGHPRIAGQSLLMGDCASCHAAPAADKSGAELWNAVCAMCHGDDGTGGRAPSLRHPSYLDARSDRELSEGIAYGTANPRMPGFAATMGGPLSDAQVDSLVQLLRKWGSTEKTADGS